MPSDSVGAYDLPERVRRYDADMDIMHPLRLKMLHTACEILPFPTEQALSALDLGTGTGVFTQRFLNAYPASHVIALDGATAMLELAKTRLGELASRVEWVEADFLNMPATILQSDRYDVIFSSYALHHLDAQQKLALLSSLLPALKPGGWFLNADIVIAQNPALEKRLQELRVEGICQRAAKGDKRFESRETTRAYLDAMEAAEHDQPQTLQSDLQILREAGLENAEVFWRHYREVVAGGSRSI